MDIESCYVVFDKVPMLERTLLTFDDLAFMCGERLLVLASSEKEAKASHPYSRHYPYLILS